MNKTSEALIASRTKHSARAVKESLENTDIDSVINELFITSKDELFSDLLKQYEKQIILAKLDFVKFEKGLHDFFNKTSEYIIENKLVEKFFEFSYFIYTSFFDKESKEAVLIAYLDLLIEQASYLGDHDKLIYGVNADGQPMFTGEIYPSIDVAMNEFEKHMSDKNSINIFKKIFKKYGYTFESFGEFEAYSRNEQLLTNMVFQCAYFIDDTTKDMFPFPYFLPATEMLRLPREWKTTDFYTSQLDNRTNLLPPSGVVATYINAKDIIEVTFKEKITENRIILLFKIKMFNGKYTLGFYDHKYKFCWTLWRESNSKAFIHDKVENFILENYCHLVTEMEIDRKKNLAIKEVDDIYKPNIFHFEYQVLVRYEQAIGAYINKNIECPKRRLFNKEDYKSELRQFSHLIRKLPFGYMPSDEAIKRAKELGYELGSGETFVRPFVKNIHKKNNP